MQHTLFWRSKFWLTVVCETNWNETKRNETKWNETKRKSVVCEMTICSLGNDNLLSRCVYSDILNRKFPPKKPFRPKNLDSAKCVTFSSPRIKFNLNSGVSNRKQDLSPFYMPCRHHICIDKCHYSYWDDLPENFPKNHCPRMQKVHFRWALKRLILTKNVTRYSNEPIKLCCLLSNMDPQWIQNQAKAPL